jgi:hypothetical protein
MADKLQRVTGPSPTGRYSGLLGQSRVTFRPVPSSTDHTSHQQRYHDKGYWWLTSDSFAGKFYILPGQPKEGDEIDISTLQVIDTLGLF